MLNKLLLLTTLLCSAFGQDEETITTLHTYDECGNYSMGQICISPSVFTGLAHEYKSLNIWVEDDSNFLNPDIKKKYRKKVTRNMLGFEFRIEGNTLFYLTRCSALSSPSQDSIGESAFICLNRVTNF